MDDPMARSLRQELLGLLLSCAVVVILVDQHVTDTLFAIIDFSGAFLGHNAL